LLIALPYIPALLGKARLVGGDTVNQFIPWIQFFVHEVRDGRFPRWDPHSFCGTPFFANAQVAFFYPFTWLAFLVSVETFLPLYYLAHGIGAGVAMYCWLHRRLRLPQAAFVGSLVWAWCGIAAGYRFAGFMAWAGATVYIPLAFLLFDLWNERHQIVHGLLLTAVLALQLHAGHPQPCLFTFYFLLAYACWQALSSRSQTLKARQRLTMISIVPLCFAGALLLAAVILLPLVEVSLFTAARQGGASYHFATTDSLPPKHLITFLAPVFFGHPADDSFWETTTGYHEICGYMGILPLILASVVLIRRPGRPFFVATAVASVVFAMGSFTPAFRILYHLIPGFVWFRVPARLLLIYSFSMAVLAAMGTADLVECEAKPIGRTTKILWGSLVAVLVVVAVVLSIGRPRVEEHLADQQKQREIQYSQESGEPFSPSPEWEQETRAACVKRFETMRSSVHQALLWTALSLFAVILYIKGKQSPALLGGLLLLVADLGLFNYGLLPYQDRDYYDCTAFAETETVRLLKSDGELFRVLTMDSAIGFLTRKTHPEIYPERLTVHGIQSVRGYNPIVLKHYAAHINRMQGFPADQPVGGLLFLPLEQRLSRQALNLMNVRYLLTYRGAPPGFDLVLQDSGLSVYRNRQEHPRAYIVRNNALTRDPVEIEEYNANSVTLKTKLDEAGVLVLADTWYPGWKALINGQKTDVEPFNEVFRAVLLEPGEHEVTFVFKPKSFFYGALISAAALIGWMLALVHSRKTTLSDKWA